MEEGEPACGLLPTGWGPRQAELACCAWTAAQAGLIGRGSFGEAYLFLDEATDGMTAVKFIKNREVGGGGRAVALAGALCCGAGRALHSSSSSWERR